MARFSAKRTAELDAQLRPLIEGQILQQRVVATMLGVSEDWVQRACTRLGLSTQRTGPRSGAGHTGWKGGLRIVKGYVMVFDPEHPNSTEQGYVAQHRLTVEKRLGRHLERHEVVHHIDGNRGNNALTNLQVFDSNGDHLRHELKGRVPNWSEDGQKRIQAGIRKAAAIHRKIKSDDDLHILSSDHQT